ncbi:hypothetical protein INT43_000143 [Umbelopsis isabellina]|uniref:DUF952 domain-containing protein n=1 Tax=Mortierella isabellina TaxID=91625 RepID=A0A8H7PF54_MORIS|nr:hypothetical protein INT43_000143 [Umbelopsis isabellina]
MAEPDYLYKIILPDNSFIEQSPASSFEPTPFDVASGFIHLSTAQQTPNTANRFFNTQDGIWILKIRYSGIAEKVKWEQVTHDDDNTKDVFPHLFGTFSMADVTDVAKLFRSEDGTWAFPQGWLQ